MGFKAIISAHEKSSIERRQNLVLQINKLKKDLAEARAIIQSNPKHGSYEKVCHLMDEIRRDALSKAQPFVPSEQWPSCRRDLLYVLGDRNLGMKLKNIFCGKEDENDGV